MANRLGARPARLAASTYIQIDAAGTDREGIGPTCHSAKAWIWLHDCKTGPRRSFHLIPKPASYGSIPQIVASLE